MRTPRTITMDADAFGYLSLGALATYVYLLCDPGASPERIGAATKRSRATVYRSLRQLRDAGLVSSQVSFEVVRTTDLRQERAA